MGFLKHWERVLLGREQQVQRAPAEDMLEVALLGPVLPREALRVADTPLEAEQPGLEPQAEEPQAAGLKLAEGMPEAGAGDIAEAVAHPPHMPSATPKPAPKAEEFS